MDRYCASLLALAFVAGACGDDDLWQAEAAEFVRELPLLDEVEVVRMSREEFSARAAAQADTISDGYLQYYADTYGRLGYFDRSIDLRPVFAGSSSDWVGASYSPSSARITLVGDARDDTIVHEFVHAIQDQHFDLSEYDALATSDSFLSRRAIVEGDAVLGQARFIMVYERGGDLDGLDWGATMTNYRDFSYATLVEAVYPVVFLDYVSFVYAYGLEYGAANLLGITIEAPDPVPATHDWALANELFTSRPADTTQRILLRDYMLDSADEVVEVGLAAVPEQLSSRLELIDWDSLGEWYVYLLLFPLERIGRGAGSSPGVGGARLELVEELDGRALAAAWDGDRALFVRDVASDEVATIWASAWDDADSAAAIAAAMWDIYGYTELKGLPVPIGQADDGELVWIEQRGNRLVVAKNLALDVVEEMVEEGFAQPGTAPLRRHPSLAAALDKRVKVE